MTREFVETSTNTAETIEEVKSNIGILGDDEILAKISYLGQSTTQPIINELYEIYKVKTNILAGNIEFINGTAVGNLIVTLKGDDDKINQVKEYLREKETELEILGGKDGIF